MLDIVDGISELLKSNRADIPLSTPTWNAVQNSGVTINLMGHVFYNDLIATYSAIETLNYYIANRITVDKFECMNDIFQSAKSVISKINAEKQ